MTVPLDSPDQDAQSVREWQIFLDKYAAGTFPSDIAPPIPLIPSHVVRPSGDRQIPVQAWAYADAPLYSVGEITLEAARRIRDYYCEHGYLPPPRSPLEASRHALINEYDLYSQKQLVNIQSATDLISEFFHGTICTFSLFHDRIQKHFTISGSAELIKSFALEAGGRIPSEDSLCGHAVLHDESVFIVEDLQNDWRYHSNPFVQAGFKSFIGSTVSLRLDPLRDGSEGKRIGVGTLNICFINEPLIDISASQRNVIKHVTSMLETQLRATWEGDQRTKEGRARMAISDFIEEALVDLSLEQAPNKRIQAAAKSAVVRIANVLPELENVMVLDMSGVHLTVSSIVHAIIYIGRSTLPCHNSAAQLHLCREGDDRGTRVSDNQSGDKQLPRSLEVFQHRGYPLKTPSTVNEGRTRVEGCADEMTGQHLCRGSW
jgi:hypothetical protein